MEKGTIPKRPPPPKQHPHTNSAAGAQAFDENRQSSDSFKDLYKKAYSEINLALSEDEHGNYSGAISHYQAGCDLIHEALSAHFPDDDGDIESKREKMRATLEYSRERLRELQFMANVNAAGLRHTALPSYSQASAPPEDMPPAAHAAPANADVILEINHAQVFFITAEGYVSTPSYPSSLRICNFKNQSVAGAPEYFLQIGSWTYPLVGNLSPSLQKSDFTYIFPDVTSTEEGAAVGIIIGDETATDEIGAFEDLLKGLCAVQHSETPMPVSEHEAVASNPAIASTSAGLYPKLDTAAAQKPPTAMGTDTEDKLVPAALGVANVADDQQGNLTTKIGQGISTAAEYIKWGLEKGAEKLSDAISYGGDKVRASLDPAQEEKQVTETTRRRIQTARYATNKVVMVSSYAVKTLGDATVALAKKAAPHIKNQAVKFVPKSLGDKMTSNADSSGNGKSTLDDLYDVAHTGVKSFGVVYLSLEQAGKALGRALADQTIATVTHRYGQQYGQVTENAMYTVGNTVMSYHNITNLGPKAIAKRAVKDTAKAVIARPDVPAVTVPNQNLTIEEMPPEKAVSNQKS